MSHLKICVYAIAKNEAAFVRRFCESARDADMIFVADTGSTDDTVSLLEECGATVVHISIKPWRFDDARNAALALIPSEFDVVVTLDLDEVLTPGWRDEVERLWTPETTCLRHQHKWGEGREFSHCKFHARHGFRWKHPVHEVPTADRITEVWADTSMVLTVHKQDPKKSRAQYLDLLRVSCEEIPSDTRQAFYYGRELKFYGHWQKAIDQCKKYLAMPETTWADERGYACRVIGACYQELKDWDNALKWHRLATIESPHTREPWCELALCCHARQRWAECFGAAITCLSLEIKQNCYTVDPMCWGPLPHDLAGIAAWNLGLWETALDHSKKALALDPDEFRLRDNVKFMQEKVDSLHRPAVEDAA